MKVILPSKDDTIVLKAGQVWKTNAVIFLIAEDDDKLVCGMLRRSGKADLGHGGIREGAGLVEWMNARAGLKLVGNVSDLIAGRLKI